MGRRSRISFLRFTPLILTLAVGTTIIVKSGYGEIKEIINEYRMEKELDDINNAASESENSTLEVQDKIISETLKTVLETIPENITKEEQVENIQPEIEEETIVRREISDELLTSGYEFKNINFDELIKRNSDVNAWITVDGTNIDYPIMYAPEKESDYYLHRDINQNESSDGSLYLFGANKSLNSLEDDISDVSIIFGHHMRGGRMFAQICNYVNQSYYDKHPYGIIYTPDGYAYKLSFFAGKVIPGSNNNELYAVDYINEEIFNNLIDFAKDGSTFESDFEVEFGDKIMILVSCEYTGGTNSRYALYGVMEKQYINELQIVNNDEKQHRSR